MRPGKEGSTQAGTSAGPVNNEEMQKTKEEMAKKAEEKTSREITDLTAEQEKVDAILAAIASLKANVQQTES